MSQPKSLRWTVKQKNVAKLLQQGMTNAQISKQVKIDKSVVTKVKKALALGDIPENQIKKSKVLKKGLTPPPGGHEAKATVSQHFPYFLQAEKLPPVEPAVVAPASIDSSLLLLKPITTDCALTPIMLNARYVAITEFGWPEDVTWEDFFDTCLVHLFRAWGYRLQGYYKLEDKDIKDSPKPVSGEPDVNGFKGDALVAKAKKALKEILAESKGPAAPQWLVR